MVLAMEPRAKPRVLVETADMSREDWLAARRAGIGSSDAAAVLGIDPFRSPLAVYLDKTGQAPAEAPSRFLYWGTVLEPLVADWWCEETGKAVRRRNAILQHATHDHMLADVDRRVVGEPALLEIKTTSAFKAGDWLDGDIPPHVVCQVQHQLAVTGDDYAYVAVLVGGNDPRQSRIERDEDLIALLVEREAAFWADVQARREPAPSKASDEDLMRALYPSETAGETITLPPQAHDALLALLNAKEARKAAEDAEEAAKAVVQHYLGTASAGILPGQDQPAVTWRTEVRKPHTVAGSTTRVLRPKEAIIRG